ncbi:HAMP domain-containing histidine kinase [Flavobacterium sp. F-380]|uniref:histidine kinase n=1 Tax=Flavobacterium kayseriense TaxID=2764714 RepID=A0ABR7J9A2_9FLAO|nr:HAMP domain-containing sensor histidine kinase [Flavobacterium kayseriense]MBC5841973.1 HAMP domain-containing histidine kinase [Flavobacterium kayseriense]MBC5848502.1 HAMP domain-containing histidine kinase [Flavobacterium kayseriense]
MIEPQKFNQEEERLKILESYSILDSLPEADYENLTKIASHICNTPIALITFVDENRQWFKSRQGLDISETPRSVSFCGHAINDPKNIFIVPDARDDFRFHDNPVVTGQPNIVFYAGIPLKNEDGLPLGTICVIDHQPRVLSVEQINSLKALSEQTMKLLELRLHKKQLEKALVELEKKNLALERFAYVAAHDLKSPLHNISGLTDMFLYNYKESIDQEGTQILSLIKSSSERLKELIDSLLDYSKSNVIDKEKNTNISVVRLEKEITSLFAFHNNCSIVFKSNTEELLANKSALEQILVNLLTNAIKYNDKEKIEITIDITETKGQYEIIVSDNGPGIVKEHQEMIFEIFETVTSIDRFGEKGNGIGLATVKKIVEALGGEITVDSSLGKGAIFKFTLAR